MIPLENTTGNEDQMLTEANDAGLLDTSVFILLERLDKRLTDAKCCIARLEDELAARIDNP